MAESMGDQCDRKCELGYLHKADGSCLYSLGNTVVLASVNGPGDLRSSKQLGDRALIEIYFHTKVGGSTVSGNSTMANRNAERLLRSICESCILTKQFPRSTVVITVQELHDDGSLVAAAINATCLALIDAGLPMSSVFVAINCVLRKSNNDQVLMVEPNMELESGDVRAKMIFIFESGGGTVNGDSNIDVETAGTVLSSCSMDGIISQDQLKTAREMARKVADDIFKLYRTVVEKKFRQRSEFVDRKVAAISEK